MWNLFGVNMCQTLKGRPHTFNNIGLESGFVSQGKRTLDLEHVPNFEETGFRIGPSFIEYKRLFQLRSKTTISQGLKLPFVIKVSMHTEECDVT